ncbi:hypothetical protein GGF46_005193 [Coemansia sp. RSA 552]|nr:hypothetical protein GGF46_005193 [Coemansia sp. RSA 552]
MDRAESWGWVSRFVPGQTALPPSLQASKPGLGGAQSKNTLVLDAVDVETAIALIVRARQQDEADGNADMAATLYVAGLKKLASAIQAPGNVNSPKVREQLTTLRLLLEPRPASAAAGGILCAPAKVQDEASAGNTALWALLALLNQIIVAWLVIVGNLCVWLADQFRQSAMPEAVARSLARTARLAYGTCRAWGVPEYAAQAGRVSVGWLAAVDREAKLSRKLACSAAAVLSAVAKVATEAATSD